MTCLFFFFFFCFQAEDGIRDLVRSRGLGDVYKRQPRSGVGKVDDLFARRGLEGGHTRDNPEGIARILDLSLIHI